MVDKDVTQEEIPKEPALKQEPPNQGQLVLAELRNIARLIGSMSLAVNSKLDLMQKDLERAKVSLGHIKRVDRDGPPITPDAPPRYVPPTPGIDQ